MSTRRDDAAAVIALLAERYPQTFALYEQRRRPLKLKIHLDLAAALDGAFTWRELRNALHAYANSAGYLQNLRAGVPRVGLDGMPAGIVTEAAHAREILTARRARKAAASADNFRKMAAPAPAAIPPPRQATSPVKRDGLADLRLAAQARKRALSEGTPP
jgi:ProP effector